MIRLHEENVNEIQLLVAERKLDGTLGHKEVSGREAFEYFKNKLEIVYDYIPEKGLYKGREFGMAYQAFFFGIRNKAAFKELNDLVDYHASKFVAPSAGRRHTDFLNKNYVIAKYKILQVHDNKLGHYYRHLFQTVKFKFLSD